MINIKRLTKSYRKEDNLKFYCLSKYKLYKLLETSKTYIKLKYIIPKVVEIEITNSNVILLPLLISFLLSCVMLLDHGIFNQVYSIFDWLFLNHNTIIFNDAYDYYATLATGILTTIAISWIMSFITIIILMIILSAVSIAINFVVELISSIIIIRKATK